MRPQSQVIETHTRKKGTTQGCTAPVEQAVHQPHASLRGQSWHEHCAVRTCRAVHCRIKPGSRRQDSGMDVAPCYAACL